MRPQVPAAFLILFACAGPATPPDNLVECMDRVDEPLPRDWGEARSEHLQVSGVRVVTRDGGRLDWGPDGRIVFDRRTRDSLYDVWIMDPADPDGASCVTCDAELPPGHRGTPAWHPSGEWILIQVGVKVGNPLVTHPGSGVANELWAIRPDGSDPRELFDIADPSSQDGALHPHFNHAGDELVFARYRRLPAVFEIHTLPFDATDPRTEVPVPVLPDGDPGWSDALYETHGYTPDDRYLLFTGFTDATGVNNDILIAEAECRRLVDQVTASDDVWDEHAHFQPGVDRLVWSSSADIPGGQGSPVLGAIDSRADLWVRESDGTKHRITRFNEEDWPLRQAETVDGTPLEIGTDDLFVGDGAFNADGSAFAAVLLFRTLSAEEWIVILDLEEAAP